jgi:RNA polymerase-binding protein DksA
LQDFRDVRLIARRRTDKQYRPSGSRYEMKGNWPSGLRQELLRKKDELNARLERITANLRRGLESDSKERAKQLEDSDVVDALGNEAREELGKISATLRRMDSGDFGICNECGLAISKERLLAYPYAEECIDCARLDDRVKARS